MSKVWLPTLDYPPRTGGVARYLQAIKQTLGDDLEVTFFEEVPSRFNLFLKIYFGYRNHDQVWTSHILPIGTMLWLTSVLNWWTYGVKPKKLRYTVFLHGMDFDLAQRSVWKRWLSRQILKKAEHLFTNTQALAREVEAFVDRKPQVVYPCVSDALVEASNVVRSVEHDGFTLLTVARLVERKGHMDVLEVVKNDERLHYTIVGDGPMRSTIEIFIEKHGLQDRVTLHQSLPDRKLPSVYASADLFVMPTQKTETDREGFGIVYLEAQLFGLPVVAVSHPGVDEAIGQGVGGILISDPKDLEKTISQLVSDNEKLANLSKHGTIFVKERFVREKQFGVLRAYV